MFGYRLVTCRTDAGRLAEGFEAGIVSEIGVGYGMLERSEWISDVGVEAIVAVELYVRGLDAMLGQQPDGVVLLSKLGDVVDEGVELGCDGASGVGARIVMTQLDGELVEAKDFIVC